MANEGNASETFKRRDASSYDGVADSFARLAERFTSPIARRMVDLATLDATSRVLDIGTGTGIVAIEAAKRMGPDGRVVGVDLSEGMLKTAREKASAAGLAQRMAFHREDAEALKLPDASFDTVLSLYTIPHFPNPDVALAQMFRVLRPGGRLVIAIGTHPPLLSRQGLAYLWRRLPALVQKRRGRWLAAPEFLDGLVKKHVAGDFGPNESAARVYPVTASDALELVEAAGFVDVRSVAEPRLGVLSTPEEFWELQMVFSSFSRKHLEFAPPEQVEAIKDDFNTRCREIQARGGRLTYPYAAYIVRARRPLASDDGEPNTSAKPS